MASPKSKWFVFDVESVGLHGEGFAVGFVILDHEGNKLEEGLYSCPINTARGIRKEDIDWVNENVTTFGITSHPSPWQMRQAFWEKWSEHRDTAELVADCAWPVEAKFLIDCVEDDSLSRYWHGPYPLHDLASMLLAHGHDPIASYGRIDSEKPEHNPLCDARQSARILLAVMTGQPLPPPVTASR